MNSPIFHVEPADWSYEPDRLALQDIRQRVFVQEQHVPEARERDGLDEACRHVLARDAEGHAIGCGRMSHERKIGRMAVLPAWRGRGVGAAMLQALIAQARAMAWPDVSLGAQVSARDFYLRAGFAPYGEIFDDAGMPHQSMRLQLATGEQPSDPPIATTIIVSGHEHAAATRLQLLAATRHRLDIWLPSLDRPLYSSREELAEMRRIASSGRSARIRMLLHDPAAALRLDHRLVALAQRLPSMIEVRRPVEQADRERISAGMLNDTGGHLFFVEADRPYGRAALNDRLTAAPLAQQFETIWERSERAREWLVLGI